MNYYTLSIIYTCVSIILLNYKYITPATTYASNMNKVFTINLNVDSKHRQYSYVRERYVTHTDQL